MTPDQAEEEVWTVGRLLRWTTDFLTRHGSDSPRLESEILLAKALDWQRVKLYMNINEEVGGLGRATFRELVKKRSAGEPVAYLVGHKEFYSLDFEVGPDVLIPRPDTEILVMTFLELAKDLESPLCVDVGTGSGCIAVACVRHHATARFIAIDKSTKALGVASRNIHKHGFQDRIEIRNGSLLEPLKADERPNFIISNPPYIPTSDIAGLDATVQKYEPVSALDGGPDGLLLVRELLRQSAVRIAPQGTVIMEIGHDQAAKLESEYSESAEWAFQGVRKDLGGISRVVIFQKKS
jgi:release factor glutamine methyltransferase